MAKKKQIKPAGRPRQFEDRVKWTVFLDATVANAADEHRKADERSQSWLVGRALEYYLETHRAYKS